MIEHIWLVVRGMGHGPGAYRVRLGRQSIGRAPTSDLHLTHASVSHDHAEIEFGRAGLTIRDCGSRNGTFINGERVHEHPFLPGDTVWIAYVSLDVLIGDAHAPHVDDPEETPIPERTNRRAAADDRLTAAQQPIFRRLIQGLSEAQIADAMCLSYHTVHSHVKNIYKGYGVNSRRELMAGLLDQAAERQGAV